jgi:hypothetical protein
MRCPAGATRMPADLDDVARLIDATQPGPGQARPLQALATAGSGSVWIRLNKFRLPFG